MTINPFDFFVEDEAKFYPFKYEKQLSTELTPYFEIKENGPLLQKLLKVTKIICWEIAKYVRYFPQSWTQRYDDLLGIIDSEKYFENQYDEH